MIFTETPLSGAFLIDVEALHDDRGMFARTFCAREFREHGLNDNWVQCNVSTNFRVGTVRGMHYQESPASEVKLVRCVRGGVWDVIVDLRPDSRTYGQHFAVELTEDNHRALYIPESFAHGFQTLRDDTEVLYQMGEFHDGAAARGFRHDDPAFGIEWPQPARVISEQDLSWPAFVK